jgi:hypothetical protein
MGTRSPSARTMKAERPTTGLPVANVVRRAQSVSQRLARNTSQQGRPIACSRRIPVIVSAARLKEVTRQPSSTVKTPSQMLSRMMEVDLARGPSRSG